MEQGSTSLSTSACNGYRNSALQSKPKVFLSHSGAQKGFGEQLCVDLERNDRHPFFDRRRDCLPIGKAFPSVIFEAIEQCEVGVVVLSEEFFTSKWLMLELVAMTNVKKRKPSFKILPLFLGISLSQFRDVDNHKRWLSLWHIWAERDSKIDLKDCANALQLFGLTNALKYNFELGEVKFREEIVEAICRLVPPETRLECDSRIDSKDRANALQSFGPTNALKFNCIPSGAVYRRPKSNKFEPRIKFPVTRGVGGKSKRIPLGLYDTEAEGEVAYEISAFYCKKPKHTGLLDLGGGAYFPIPALSVDPDLPYEEKVKQVRDQVFKVHAEFKKRKASRDLPSSVPGLAFAMPTGEGQLLATSPIQQLGQPFNSGMDSAMQCQGSQLVPNTHNGVDFNNPGCFLPVLLKTQQVFLDAHEQNKCLKTRVSRTEVENMGWEIKYSELDRKYSELERKYSELEQRNLQLEHENGLLNHQIMQSPLQTLDQELEI